MKGERQLKLYWFVCNLYGKKPLAIRLLSKDLQKREIKYRVYLDAESEFLQTTLIELFQKDFENFISLELAEHRMYFDILLEL